MLGRRGNGRIAGRAARIALVALVGCGAAAPDAGSGSGSADLVAAPATAPMRVHYPAGFGHRITLRCSPAWGDAIATSWGEGDVWSATVPAGSTCKPLLDDATWSIGPNHAPGDVWPHFFHSAGEVARRTIGARGVWVYTPPSYAENPRQDYPVVYMHDGQNLFDDRAAFGGVSWDVGGAMNDGIQAGTIPEALVVGIENGPARIAEYTPVADPDYGGGDAEAYLGFVIGTVKVAIDGAYRTRPAAGSTAIVGSSLGGLVSLHAGLAHPETFGLVGALSPSTWWDGTWIVARTEASAPAVRRVYLDSGNAGASQDDVTDTAKLAAAWKAKPGVEVDYRVQDGASHSETYWRQRIPGALAFLLR